MSHHDADTGTHDVVVYGATSGGVAAAVAAAGEGATVALVDPLAHVGGMVSGGLTRSDVERQECLIGGLARRFFDEVSARYDGSLPWRFEPRVAEEVLRGWLEGAGVTSYLDVGVVRAEVDHRCLGALAWGGQRVTGTTFVDASYEGDLLAQAGASYDVGRDGRERHGEPLAGRAEMLPNPHQFDVPVSAVDGHGGLLPRITPYERIVPTGAGDGKLQSYCYRLCLTDDPGLAVPIEAPAGYDPATFELVRRYLVALGPRADVRSFMGLGELPNAKFDVNSGGPVSTNLLGASFRYPDAGLDERRGIEQEHRDWTQGLLYYLGHDPAVPKRIREQMARYGLPADEFEDGDHWPTQLYVRDARRLLGEYVLTEHDLRGPSGRRFPDAIGMAGYNIDIREVEWVAAPTYRFPDVFPEVMTEGYVSVPVDPYQIPYRCLLPRRSELTNLLVSSCISASHVAFASFRMESQFMIAGQAAGVAAALASGDEGRVHDVDVRALQRRLEQQGQVLGTRDP